ncbi:MAG: hypothetical protein RI947_1442 [Candidatus Parcubacteria bacterium]
MSLTQLQQHGITEFADVWYRAEVSRRMAQSAQAECLVTFDDVAMAVPEGQRHLLHGLPGYERVMLPTLWMASGFTGGAVALVIAPPNPVERAYVSVLHTKLETMLGRPVPFEVLYEHNGTLIDLMKVDEQTYAQLCVSYAQSMSVVDNVKAIDELSQLRLVCKYADILVQRGRLLVSPFQVTQQHIDALDRYVQSGQMVLPDLPVMNKAFNNLWLKSEGFPHLPEILAVTLDGGITADLDQLVVWTAGYTDGLRRNNQDRIHVYSMALIDAIDRFIANGQTPMLKIDADGVSGLGNISRRAHSEVYNNRLPRQLRVGLLAGLIEQSLQGGKLPMVGIVEEFVTPGVIEEVTQDYTVCGMMVDGVFLPTSINPFGTTDGIYDREWVAPRAEDLKEDPLLWESLFRAYAWMGEVLTRQGYHNGILAGDIFALADGQLRQHDWNLRRGGRSVPETIIMFENGGWFEAQIEVDLTAYADRFDAESLYELYSVVCADLMERGIYPFATSFGYFGMHHGNIFIKLKLMVPMNMFLGIVPRSDQLQFVRDLATEVVYRYLD